MNTLQDIVIFCGKGCQVVKTPINTGVATSKRLSEVVIRLSSPGGWVMVDCGWRIVIVYWKIRTPFEQTEAVFA
jgi:hypothetical protein